MKRTRFFCILMCLAAMALCMLLASGCGAKPAPSQLTVTAPAASAPNMPRPILNYNGCRYAFLENGAEFSLQQQDFAEELGTLEYNILENPEENSKKDFSATFAIGGTVYSLNSCDPAFRIAVGLEDRFYLCERVTAGEGAPPDAAEYFAAARFEEITGKILVNDHMDRETLAEVTGKEVQKMIGLLAESTPVKLTDEQYMAIGRAQNEGKSFHLAFSLNDGTAYRLYVIPELSLAMIGDGKYTLSEAFLAEYTELFAGLKQQPLPMA